MSNDTTDYKISPVIRIRFDNRDEEYIIYDDEETRQRDLELLAASIENEDTLCLNETHHIRCSRVVKWQAEYYYPERSLSWYDRQQESKPLPQFDWLDRAMGKDEAANDEQK